MRPLLSTHEFLRRVVANVVWGLAVVAVSLVVGMLGYHVLEGRPWIDSFLDASMILSGMGPTWNPQSAAGKIFAGLYALYSGLAVLIIAGVMLAPAVHRFLHRFHLEAGRDDPEDDR